METKTTRNQRDQWIKQQPNMAYWQEKLCDDVNSLEARCAELEKLSKWQADLLSRAKIKIEMARKMLKMEGWDDSWIEDLERGPPK